MPNKGENLHENVQEMGPQENVCGIIVLDSQGAPILTTFNTSQTAYYGSLMSTLAGEAKSLGQDLDSSDDVTLLQIMSKKQNILITSDPNFTVIVLTPIE